MASVVPSNHSNFVNIVSILTSKAGEPCKRNSFQGSYGASTIKLVISLFLKSGLQQFLRLFQSSADLT